MFVKTKDAARLAKQNEKLRKMYEVEREKNAGYEELSNIQNAYIAVLLKKMGATEEHPIIVTNGEVKALLGSKLVTVNVVEKGKWQFYIEEDKE